MKRVEVWWEKVRREEVKMKYRGDYSIDLRCRHGDR